MYDTLKAGIFGEVECVLNDFRSNCSQAFPYALIFKPPGSNSDGDTRSAMAPGNNHIGDGDDDFETSNSAQKT